MIEIKNVSQSYIKGKYIIENMNLKKKRIKGSFAQSMKYLETGMHIKNHKLSYVIVE